MRLLELDLLCPLHLDDLEEPFRPFDVVIAGEHLASLLSEVLILFDCEQRRSQFVILALGDRHIFDLAQDLLQVIIKQLK